MTAGGIGFPPNSIELQMITLQFGIGRTDQRKTKNVLDRYRNYSTNAEVGDRVRGAAKDMIPAPVYAIAQAHIRCRMCELGIVTEARPGGYAGWFLRAAGVGY
jgi:hypothetical protein